MKRSVICLIIIVSLLLPCISFAETTEMRAVWFSYQDYKSNLFALSENDFRARADEICKNISEAGMNTIIFHVRAFSDAFYDSAYFQYSKYVQGEAGVSPGYDPLKLMCEAVAKHGLSIHAWINPYRIGAPTNVTESSVAHSWKSLYSNDRISEYNGSWYYNPASPYVREYIINGVREIVKNYDVDGIHFDDYFYPTADEDFDKTSYEMSGSALSLNEWRLENVNTLIKDTYSAIKEINPNVVFGISPNADIEKNYESLFADVKKWGSQSGYADYITPQIYFGFENSTLPFEQTADRWCELCTEPDLYIGIAAYKSGLEDKWAGDGKNEWIERSDICSRQIAYLRNKENYKGFMLFSYSSLFSESATPSAKAELEKITSLLKESQTTPQPVISFMDMIKTILKYIFIFN